MTTANPAGFPVMGMLLKLGGRGTAFAGAVRDLARQGEPILEVADAGDGLGAAGGGATWFRFAEAENVWEQAHDLSRRAGMGFGTGGVLAAEPDRQWVRPAAEPPRKAAAGGGFDAWHLAKTGLDAARTGVHADKQKGVLIAHLDTGFDPDHAQCPAHVDPAHVSFVRGDDPAHGAITPKGGLPGVEQPGHGTATLALLAGPGYGGAPGARVLPIRVGKDVVIVTTGSVVAGMNEAIRRKAQVLSMSMGGLASGAMAEAVNEAYMNGLLMVTAAGNTIGGLPFPTIVWPARFRRVVAACGIMKDGQSYEWPKSKPMAGCHGPDAKMPYALSAYTPDIPWAEMGTKTEVSRGGGTSSATPQIASAAALWLATWQAEMAAYAPWQRVEAARQALFASARDMEGQTVHPKFGCGVLDVTALLATKPLAAAQLKQAPVADASFAFLKLVSGKGVGFAGPDDRLFELELIQLLEAHRDLAGETKAGDWTPDIPSPETLDSENPADVAAVRRVLERVADSPHASAPLRAEVKARLAGNAARPMVAVPPPPALPPALPPAPAAAPGPARRRLRIYTRDPSLSASLSTSRHLVATVDVRNEPDLQPGPVGEYLEVVDVDPASDRVYHPVDLNATGLALSDGLKPSEGNPRFHQQMVYAVAMRTIEAFEQALGREMLWASGRSPEDGRGKPRPPGFRRRLRLYPHALREANAYYSPERVAILFGYFPSTADSRSSVPAGSLVFSCLSADVIAHEVTHALLDGLSPPFRDPSNPDVLAFHEGFADIVALFEQFRLPELVRGQVAAGRGNFALGRMLGTLAMQLGEGRGGRGPLRDYADPRSREATSADWQYDTKLPVHKLGGVLVMAVYSAFLAMAELRTAELVRMATGGTGRLPEGELHPVLVDGLAREISKAAADMQRIAIRALDYLPPNDLSFGDYLRALITADVDAWPEDQSGYRTAIIEAFRQRDIYPRGLRTLSDETLVWPRVPDADASPAWLGPLVKGMRLQPGTSYSRRWAWWRAQSRARLASCALNAALAAERKAGGNRLDTLLGLDPGLPVYVDDVRAKMRELGPTEQMSKKLAFDLVIRVRQRRDEPVDPADPGGRRFWFRGGATLVIDPFATIGDRLAPRIRYAIAKPMTAARLAREQAWRQGAGSEGVRGSYFGAGADGHGMDEPFALLHRGEER